MKAGWVSVSILLIIDRTVIPYVDFKISGIFCNITLHAIIIEWDDLKKIPFQKQELQKRLAFCQITSYSSKSHKQEGLCKSPVHKPERVWFLWIELLKKCDMIEDCQ